MRQAWGDGLATVRGGEALDVFFAQPHLGVPPEGQQLAKDLVESEREDPLRGVAIKAVRVVIILDEPVADVPDAYLRLHLLSHRAVRPNEVNLEGIFAALPNVCWTSLGPVHPDDVVVVRLRCLSAGTHVDVHAVDKFPKMTDYVVPSGVRIADASRVRLGAHLAEGTTVMHEGFVNFNAGTLGAAMIEGRISQGVVVGDGSDIGCGAYSGLGISLGDDCVVEAGLYLTAGAVVALPDGPTSKAREVSGRSGLLFRRSSQTGAIEVLPRKGTWGELNTALHTGQ
jgi:2,3,4,5-tetrahydropyridine-2-carboxylate N-succinyltransferase